MALTSLGRILCVCLLVSLAHAEVHSWTKGLTGYEIAHIQRVLELNGFQARPLDGKQVVDFVHIHRYPVLVEFESLPTFPNYLHALTDEDVIRREVLLKPGSLFEEALLIETVRNLRRLGIFSLAVAIPIYDSKTQRNGLLVLTRDLWSLRLESRLQFTGSFIDQLSAQLTERNLFGRGKLVSARFIMDPFTYTTGALYSDPRLGGKRFSLLGSADAIFERETNRYDGFKTFLNFARPFYNFGQKWGFNGYLFFQRLSGRQARQGVLLGYDDPETTEVELIPRLWESESISSEVLVSHQTGKRVILRSSVGIGALDYHAYAVKDSKLADYSAQTQARFRQDVIPDDQRWFYPVLAAEFFENRYKSFLNLSGYAFSEYVQLGLSGRARIRTPLAVFGSSQDLALLGGSLTFREAILKDGLFELSAGCQSRYDRATGRFGDTGYLLRNRVASPWLGAGRLVARHDLLYYADPVRLYALTLGGDNGLRGYPSQNFVSFGGGRLRSNVEFRSAPVELFTFRAGLVGFYDAGILYDGSQATGLKQSVGAGFRMIVPQASRFTYRLDFGVPLDGTGFMVTISGETNQAVPMTIEEDVISPDATSVGGLVNQP
ncbi:MAG: POTRA domain-containing protein [Myxococcota bacterium]|nr:POTRA domain-containing protein [Myxococcota bacterium]